jgi:hypothetical protein
MITCQRCQTENLDGSQYCDECGAALSGTQQQQQGARRPTAGDGHNAPVSAPSPEPAAFAAPQPEPSAFDAPAPERVRGAVEAPVVANSQAGSPARASLLGQTSSPRKVEESVSRRGSSASPHAKLVIHRGRSVGKEFPLSEEESHIGRWDADGGIFPDVDLDSDDPEAKVSRRHARITRRGGQYYIEDLGSTNGTFVNRGRRLLPGDRQGLRDGDEVIVGKTFLKFHVLN